MLYCHIRIPDRARIKKKKRVDGDGFRGAEMYNPGLEDYGAI